MLRKGTSPWRLDLAGGLLTLLGAVLALLCVGVQYSRFGSEELAGIPMRRHQVFVLSALELPITARWSAVVQELFNTGAARDFYEFSEATHEIVAGVKGEILPHTLFEFGLIENLFKFDNSPDFGLHFGISRRF